MRMAEWDARLNCIRAGAELLRRSVVAAAQRDVVAGDDSNAVAAAAAVSLDASGTSASSVKPTDTGVRKDVTSLLETAVARFVCGDA